MIKYTIHRIFFFCLAGLGVGCANYQVIPENLENQVNHQLRFAEVRDHPEAYQGELMVIGGEVLSIERLEDKTKMIILQLPLNDDMIPADRRTTTNGRFIAVSKDIDLDPAVFEQELSVTLVGEILGSETVQVDKDEQEVPVYVIKDLTIWDEERYWKTQDFENPAAFYTGYRPFGYPYY